MLFMAEPFKLVARGVAIVTEQQFSTETQSQAVQSPLRMARLNDQPTVPLDENKSAREKNSDPNAKDMGFAGSSTAWRSPPAARPAVLATSSLKNIQPG